MSRTRTRLLQAIADCAKRELDFDQIGALYNRGAPATKDAIAELAAFDDEHGSTPFDEARELIAKMRADNAKEWNDLRRTHEALASVWYETEDANSAWYETDDAKPGGPICARGRELLTKALDLECDLTGDCKAGHIIIVALGLEEDETL